MEYENFFPIRKRSIWFKYFCFIDTNKHLADNVFIKNKVRVWFQMEARKPDTDFVFIFCKIKKSDIHRFLESLEELKKKMLILGHTDYEDFCKKFHDKYLVEGENA